MCKMKQGKIVKGIAGFYYVSVAGSGIYECKAKGAFRQKKMKPLVGDNVSIDIIDEEEKKGNVVEILPRKNALIRPAVANVDQALVIFAGTSPKPNLNLLDRFLLMMEQQNVPTLICFNKEDLASEAEIQELRDAYETSGYPLFFVSARQQEGIEPLRAALEGKTTTVAGPSGVGKSTLINLLAPEVQMETGEISEKIQRGKHTTRHSQLILLNEQTYIFDTPGFSSLAVDFFEKESLGTLFPEFVEYEQNCRFTGCSHIGEPVCGVKEALAEGKISQSRYNNYVQIYNELKDKRKY
nr:ribosome small subunit-dependent GTPase A [uncultured Eubacterium sp.]